ncbi:MAG: PaaI family thioesterase [Pelomonas sp.]|nr:PaaI family thioesterase [Roseateles sp.]
MPQEDLTPQWIAEEQAARATLAAPGVATPDQVAGMSAMQIFDAISAGQLPQPPMGSTLDFIPIRVEPGKAIFQGRPNKRHYNPMGTVHGGWFAAMLDSALGCAIHSTLPAGKGYTTLELKVNLVRALTDVVPMVRAEGTLIHGGRQVATSEARIIGPDGKLYAHATTTCLIFDLPPAKA